ncbi:MAG TPA: hypothetical protein VGT01_02140 [Candidatus Dormibacteraeota bacterium]|nr:hypothetical protein [Candidatus Dormibacteraeota bacterium]
MARSEDLGELIYNVMRGRGAMTTAQIASAMQRRTGVKTKIRTVTEILEGRPGRFRRLPRKFLQRSTRWQLVEVAASDNPGTAGAPVPARPFTPTLSGAAAAELTFRQDEPPTNAIGRIA